MIVKPHEVNQYIKRLDALSRRMLKSHPKYHNVHRDLLIQRAGERGEKAVDYPLGNFHDEEIEIYHSVRLEDRNGYFQIDTLLLTSKLILILEMKNWNGTIVFGENGQVTRVNEAGKEEGFLNPIPQVMLQKHRLQKWLEQKQIENIPIYYFVVISFPETIIKASIPGLIPNRVIHCNQLFFKIKELMHKSKKKVISNEVQRRIRLAILSEHKAREDDVLSKYDISVDELVKGVFCEKCFTSSMEIAYGKWHCVTCRHSCKKAHHSALNDYRLLIGNSVKNRDIRGFLQIESPFVTKRLLKRMGYSSQGDKNNTIYTLSEHEKE